MPAKSAAARRVREGKMTWKELFIQQCKKNVFQIFSHYTAFFGGSCLNESTMFLSLFPVTLEYERDTSDLLIKMMVTSSLSKNSNLQRNTSDTLAILFNIEIR